METTIKSTENGPNLLLVDDKVRIALCRCGHSEKKPFCDGSHHKANFKAEAHEMKIDFLK